MKSYQQYLKTIREKNKLSVEGVASKMSFSAKTIEMLEESADIFSLNLPTPSLKNYFRKYAETLGIPEKRIIRLLNRIDYLDYKRSRKGKMKAFDYINRLIILILIVALGYTVHALYQQEKANALKQSVVTLPSPVVTPSSADTTATNIAPPVTQDEHNTTKNKTDQP